MEWIQFLQKLRSPFLDHLIQLFDFFDRQEFLFILIPIVWIGLSWQFGIKIYYLLSLNYIVNLGLKNGFALPRPFHLDPTLGVIHVSGYGFPSGAAQTAILLSGLLLVYWKSKWKWVFAPLYPLVISFSRVYLGVHFPIDILGGWLVGMIVLGLYFLLFPRVERVFQNISPWNGFLLNVSLLVVLILYLPSAMIIPICACGIGLGVGIFINRVTPENSLIVRTRWGLGAMIAVGIIGVFLIHAIATKTFSVQSAAGTFFLFVFIGLWMSLGTQYICKKVTILCAKKS